MKKLLLIRHAKATHETGYTDFERPLTDTGVKGAEKMAAHLKERDIIPQLVVTSPALRTHATANIFTDTLKLPPATIKKAIYEAADTTLLRIINNLPDECEHVAIVGHNPAIEQMIYALSEKSIDVPPGTVALIEFDAESWQEVHEGLGKLTYHDDPKH